MGTATLTAPEQVTDTFPINGTDFIEFYVGNAKQAAQFYRNVFGYSIVAYRGPETGTRDRASYVLTQGKVRLILTTALRPDSDIASHVHKHGDGVKDIALWVDDAEDAELEFRVHLPGTLRDALRRASSARTRARDSHEQAVEATTGAVQHLVRDFGVSLRDAAELTGLSHQRLQQILAQPMAHHARSAAHRPA